MLSGSDKHVSTYDLTELYKQLDNNRVDTSPIERHLWSMSDIKTHEYARVTLNDYLCNDDVAGKVVESLVRFGCAFITNVPANQQSTEIAIKRLFPVQRTHVGEMWSLSDNKSHRHDTYTNDELVPHNEMLYLSDVPGLQVLHCISKSGSGGEISLVDGFYVLDRLKTRSPETYEYLCNVCVTSEYIDDGNHFEEVASIIQRDSMTNEPIQLR